MGFDVLYLPPIHPIGHTQRKGPNNTPGAGEEGPGSPWAIGAEEGGHEAIHPELGTVEDFVELVRRARERGIEVAIDLAFQCSPDHPWVAEHPQWFRQRPDGTVQFAENPPKRYEDIFPLDFETDDWKALWAELERIVLLWIERGVRVFRVDNPHTKPIRLWEWLISRVKERHPEVLFLAEAFTRPKVMARLAKVGFSQSYTYFTWRNTKRELEQYLTELTRTELRDHFRPNFWPNTPDILPEVLQTGGRPAFVARLVLAATLSSNYGIYGPAFELLESRPREPFSEEYLDSEKYQIRRWDIDRPDSLRELIARVNRIRRGSPALQQTADLTFVPVDNEWLIAYVKTDRRAGDTVLVVVNLDPHHRHAGWLHLDPAGVGAEADRMFQVHDLLSEARFLWSGSRSYVELDPQVMPAHLFKIRRRVRTEYDFDYFM
jgi:starch synthase (maltosyl-transferring)